MNKFLTILFIGFFITFTCISFGQANTTSSLPLLTFKPNPKGLSLGFSKLNITSNSIEYGINLSTPLLGKDQFLLGYENINSPTTKGFTESLSYNSLSIKSNYKIFSMNENNGSEIKLSFSPNKSFLFNFSNIGNYNKNTLVGTSASHINIAFNPSKNFITNLSQNSTKNNKPGISQNIIDDNLGINWILNPMASLNYQSTKKVNSINNNITNSFIHDLLSFNFQPNKSTYLKSKIENTSIINSTTNNQNNYSNLDMGYSITGIIFRILNESLHSRINNVITNTQHNLFNVAYNKKDMSSNLLSETTNINGIQQNHNLFTLNKTWNNLGMAFNMFHDVISDGIQTPNITTNLLHFDYQRNKPNHFIVEEKKVSYSNGAFVNTTQLDANFAANKNFILQYNKLNIDRGINPSQNIDTLRWSYQVNNTANVSGSYITTNTNNNTDSSFTALQIKDTINKNIILTGNFSETKQNGATITSTSNVIIENTKPIKDLLMKDTKLSLQYHNIENNQKIQNQNITGKLNGRLSYNLIAFEYNNFVDPLGLTSNSRSISLVNKNTKSPLNYNLLYRTRNINYGNLIVDQNYSLSFRINKNTNIISNYTTFPENPQLLYNYNTVETISIGIKHKINNKFNLNLDYGSVINEINKTNINRLSVALLGNLRSNISLKYGYSWDHQKNNTTFITGHTFITDYNYKLDDNHLFSINLSYTFNEGNNTDYKSINFQYKTKF